MTTKIILVEDNRGLRTVLGEWLGSLTGHEVVACINTEDLRLKADQAGEKGPIILVTDGELGGTDTCAHVLTFALDHFGRRLCGRALLTSGRSKEHWALTIATAHKAGLQVDYRQKPVMHSDLSAWWESVAHFFF